MLHRGALYLLIVALALLASPGLTPPVAAQTTIIVDDDFFNCVDGLTPDWYTISAAVADASPGDTIRVCEGDYWETQILAGSDYVTITGPGATPADDGVATVHLSSLSTLLYIDANYVVLEGLVLDVTPPDPGATTQAVQIMGSSVSIQHNEIRNATSRAVYVYEFQSGRPRYVQILDNNIHDSSEGVVCEADDCVISGNTVENVSGFVAIYVRGNNGNITSNAVVGGGSVSGSGDDLFVAENQITGPGHVPGSLLYVSGNRVAVTDNTLSDNVGQMQHGLSVDVSSSGSSVTIARNTFTNITNPILLLDTVPSDGFTLTATIGGSPSDANTFVDSGGSLGDYNYLIQMDGPTPDVNAEYNNWGLCTAAEIEQEIYDKADDPVLGAVDYEPFIAASGCSTPTPTPTPTATAIPTATPTPSATPGPTRTVTIPAGSWANFAWTGDSSPQTVVDCFGAGKVAVMYRLDAANGSFHRWIRGREGLSTMGDVQRFDALLALNTSAQPATCTMPDDVVPHSFTIPAGRWANFAWLAFSFPAEVAPEACSEGSIAVIYRLDAATRTFQRWIRGRPELSNMTDVQPYDALLALNASGQPSTCTFSHYGQLVAGSS